MSPMVMVEGFLVWILWSHAVEKKFGTRKMLRYPKISDDEWWITDLKGFLSSSLSEDR